MVALVSAPLKDYMDLKFMVHICLMGVVNRMWYMAPSLAEKSGHMFADLWSAGTKISGSFGSFHESGA